MKKKIYILGINKWAYFMQDMLDDKKCSIMGYVSMEEMDSAEEFRGLPCISYSRLSDKDFDYLLICEEHEERLDDPRYIDVTECLSIMCMRIDPEFYHLRKKYSYDMKQGDGKGIITGISCIQRGIIVENLSYKSYLCAGPGQDIYYDYLSLIKATDQAKGNLKFAIMGLVPYSFRYDLSLSKENSIKCISYYREFDDLHHTALSPTELRKLQRNDALLDQYCYSKWRDICFDHLFDYSFRRNRNEFCYEDLSEDQKKNSLEKMKRLSDKPYTKTLEENEGIFEKYIDFCVKNNIKVIVLIPPFSIFFRNHFPERYVLEMREIIRSIGEKNAFDVLDLYNSPIFESDHLYADEDHLNVKGAMKLTEILDGYLCKIMKEDHTKVLM